MSRSENRAIRYSSLDCKRGLVSDLNSPSPKRKKNSVTVDDMLRIPMKYILISPVSIAMSADDIYRYFNCNYGEVEIVSLHAAAEYRIAVVTFTHEDSAEKAIVKRQHKIAGCVVNVSIADELRPQHNSILVLNDDCIIQILKHLHEVKDFVTIANTCSRLLALAQEAFSSVFKNRVVSLNRNDENMVEDCLRYFGSQIQSIDFCSDGEYVYTCKSNNQSDTYYLHLLLKYCGSLKFLRMAGFSLHHNSDSDTEKLIPLFRRLDKLVLESGSIHAKLFRICDVTELSMEFVDLDSYDGQKRRFSRMKILKIHCEKPRYYDFIHAPHFLNLMAPPTSIECFECETLLGPAKVFGERLYLHEVIQKFKKIKTLKLYNGQGKCTGRLFAIIKQLPHLEELICGRRNTLTAAELLDTIRMGTNLRQLIVILDERSSLLMPENIADYIGELLDIVSKRPSKTPLSVILFGNVIFFENGSFNTLSGNALLKITCLREHQFRSILNLEKSQNAKDIKISNESIKVLRDHGLLF